MEIQQTSDEDKSAAERMESAIHSFYISHENMYTFYILLIFACYLIVGF